MAKVTKRPVVIIVRDGWGENPFSQWDHANAVLQANRPVDIALRKKYPFTLIRTSGEDVGLPLGIMGNSEVGHQNIGAVELSIRNCSASASYSVLVRCLRTQSCRRH